MRIRDYFSFKTTMDVEHDPPGQVIGALAEYERRTGQAASSRKSYAYNSDGTIDKTPLL